MLATVALQGYRDPQHRADTGAGGPAGARSGGLRAAHWAGGPLLAGEGTHTQGNALLPKAAIDQGLHDKFVEWFLVPACSY
jgi:hypothetical protein